MTESESTYKISVIVIIIIVVLTVVTFYIGKKQGRLKNG